MLSRTEKMERKSKEIFKTLYSQGMSINDIEELANNLINIGRLAIENEENTIARISNGQMII